MVWGKVLACELLVPIQAGAWLLLLMINGIAIENAGLILLQVSVTSLILILLGALTALHYRERTAAQFIFSTALVVVMLFALALPDNPLNLSHGSRLARREWSSGLCSGERSSSSSCSGSRPMVRGDHRKIASQRVKKER